MDSTASKAITHNLTFTDIISVNVLIYADSGAVFWLTGTDSSTSLDGSINMGSTQIGLFRRTGGIFDANTFDQTSYNRGWVFVKYFA
jgi:hypothetical protein